MLKYVESKVTFAEVPDEISLCINISNCPYRCPNCHSAYLQEDVGEELTTKKLQELISKNKGITCVCFMGGDSDLDTLGQRILECKLRSDFPYKTAWYTGASEIPKNCNLLENLDYIKVGPYREKYGPLRSVSTNQRFYRIDHTGGNISVEDKTDLFWKDAVEC